MSDHKPFPKSHDTGCSNQLFNNIEVVTPSIIFVLRSSMIFNGVPHVLDKALKLSLVKTLQLEVHLVL